MTIQLQTKEFKSGRLRRGVSALLRMPVEVVLLIAEHLPVYAQHILAQSCNSLRSILTEYLPIRNEGYKFNWLDRVDYCFYIARERLDVWVCSGCSQLHRVSYGDFPRTMVEGFTNSCRFAGLLQYLSGDFCLDGSTLFYIHEAHVQLALKYTRLRGQLSSVQQIHLRMLLLNHTGRLKDKEDLESPTGLYYTIKIFVLQGRFLLFIEYAQRRIATSVGEWQRKVINTSCGHQSNPATRISMFPGGVMGRVSPIMDELSGSCRHCATDVALMTGRVSRFVFVRIWKDLGPEVSPAHPEWMGNITENLRHPAEYGSVRTMFATTLGTETPPVDRRELVRTEE